MDIALLNVKIKIQKNTVITDAIGNHKNEWEDYYFCHATVGGESGKESSSVAQIVDDSDISFTVRYCRKVSNIDSTHFRIIFNEELYNILSVDHMNFKKRAIKFRCQKVRR